MRKKKKQPWYVIGHKNPDADAICAAIGHAEFLRQRGHKQAIAARCGAVPPRVEWILKKAGLPAPHLLDDVRPTAGSISRRNVALVREDDTFLCAYRIMVEHGVRSIPVVGEDNEVMGLLRFLDLLQLLLPPATDGMDVKLLRASLANIASAIDGNASLGAEPSQDEEDLIMMVGASAQRTVKRRLQIAKEEGSVGRYLVICGDRPAVHRYAVQYGARAILVTGDYEIDPALAANAREKGVVILCCSHDTATSVKLALCARKVRNVLHDDFLVFSSNEVVSRFAKRVAGLSQDLFPVLEAGSRKLMGVFSKSDLVDPPRVRLSLVDHNEFSQAVKGVEEARVMEILDHHRLAGDLVTRQPIRFINEPVGSSSTIVGSRFAQRGLKPSPATALCLCAGLISDTLNLTGPTTTDLDREVLGWLSEIAGVDPTSFAEDFFNSWSLLLHADDTTIINSDRKEFLEEGVTVTLSQVEETSFKGLDARKSDLIAQLEKTRAAGDHLIGVLMITDIRRHNSILLAIGDQKVLAKLPFERLSDHEWSAEGVVSRKKQLFPAVCQALR